MKKKLFGQNITPKCSYCENSVVENEFVYCKKTKQMKKDKCRAFKYDPLMRIPDSATPLQEFSADDFKIV